MIFKYTKTDKSDKHSTKQKKFTAPREEDAAPNAYAVRCIWYIIVFVAIFMVLQLLKIWIVDEGIAMSGCLGGLAFLLVAEIIAHFTDYTTPWLKYLFVLFTVIAVTVFGIFLTYHTILTSLVPLLIAAQYSRKKVLRFAYLLSLVSIFYIVILGYQYGLCDANMVIQTVSKASVYGQSLSSVIKPFSEQWFSIILFFAVPRCLIITAFVPMINAIVSNRKEIMLRDVELKYTGEHDQLTGLYNRAKYASMLKESYILLDKVAIIYFDVNNLKFVNDTFGHDMGDELIIRAADSIHGAIDEKMDAYRLGGDEFMVVIPNGNSDDADTFIENWKLKLKIINSLPSVAECNIAYGYACGSGKVFSEILSVADKNMYDNKVKSKAQKSV